MQYLWRSSLLLGLVALALMILPGTEVLGQAKKDTSESVSFKTHDGVELSGTFYPKPGGKRKAVVILLHDFTAKNGGSSSKDNLPELARALQDDGYAVLSFDFRGFGESKNVSQEFWDSRKFPHNGPMYVKRKAGKLPETIEYKNFNPAYYAYLVNDIAAAKAYLDRANDRKDVNTSNLIVIGAGQGATLGAMWVTNECRRRRDKNPNTIIGAAPMLGDPEGKDIAACLWLTISPKVESRQVGNQLQRWLKEAGNNHKIPTGFVFGSKDTAGANYARTLITHVRGTNKDLEKTVGKITIEGSNLTGSKLLEKSLKTNETLTKALATLMENRIPREWTERKGEASAYYYLLPGSKIPQINKRSGEDAPLVDVNMLLK